MCDQRNVIDKPSANFSLTEINAHLRRTLLDKYDMAQLAADFRALHSNSARVYFAGSILKTHNILPDIVHVEKCDEKSEERRKYGNHQFVALKKDHVAMKHYNKSVAYAKHKETLALAFANRSAVLFENKFYKECIQDIEYALENGYPEHLRTKINQRKQKAEKELEDTINYKEHEEYYTKVLPEIVGSENEIFECASNHIAMKTTETMGRHLIATTNIEPGDVLAVEKPYTKILLYDSYLTHCHHCLNISYNLIPCLQCPLTLYCSDTCRISAWQQYHQFECTLLDTLHTMNVTKLHLMALRVVLCARNQFKHIFADDFIVNDTDKYQQQSYKEIHNLVTNEEQRSVQDLFARSTIAAVFMHLLESTSFFDHYAPEDLVDMKTCTVELLLRHLQTAPSNMHEISELQGNVDKGYEACDIGAGAYAFLSLLNHSCAPNVVRHCHGSTIVLRALRPIAIGQQLFDNYGCHHALMKREERRTQLLDQYCFNCECEACVDDWPLYADLQSGADPDDSVVTHDQLSNLVAANRETAETLIPQFLENAKIFDEQFKNHFIKVLDNQEMLKQCFAIIGNKHRIF